MSFNIFLEPINSLEDLQAQVREQESSFGMEVFEIGIFQTDEVVPEKSNFVNITSHLAHNLPELHIQSVPPDIAANDESFSDFFNTLCATNTIVDSAMVLVSDVEQQIVLFRNGVTPVDQTGSASTSPATQTGSASTSPVPQTESALMPILPDYAIDILSAAKGMPWAKCVRLPRMDAYGGMMPGRSRLFQNLRGPDGNVMNVVYYECKFDIDNDGSGGNAANDRFHQSDTTLHDINGALDANTIAFAVLPLDRSESRVKLPNLPDFGRELGVHIGDVGVAFWRQRGVGEVRSTSFIYGDKGPANKIGEGSVHMANALGINSNPNSGGIDPSMIKQLRKGVIHIAFPGSGADFMQGRRTTTLIPSHIDDRARKFFSSLLQQPGMTNIHG